MGHQIIQQPDGRLAVWSTVIDGWALYDCTPDELADYYAEQAAERAREDTRKITDAVLAGDPSSVYRQFTMSFDEADKLHVARGNEPVPFEALKG